MNGRIYDPLLGRFLSADVEVQFPSDLQSYNRYSYARNNPLRFTDPSGFETVEQLQKTIREQQQKLEAARKAAAAAAKAGNPIPGVPKDVLAAQTRIKDAEVRIKNIVEVAAKMVDFAGQDVTPDSVRAMASSLNDTDSKFQQTSNILAIGELWPGGATAQNIVKERYGAAAASFVVETATAVLAGEAGKAFTSTVGGVPLTANFAQTSFRQAFSKTGSEELSRIAGIPIKTVEDLAAAIRSGVLDSSKVPVNYIKRGGNTLILNTRTAEALERAEIPRGQWAGVDQSGDELFEQLLTDQLKRNQLSPAGTPKVFEE